VTGEQEPRPGMVRRGRAAALILVALAGFWTAVAVGVTWLVTR
jgi:hypothetical protein